ncbi:MAG: hypothetical protein PWP45_1048 [Tepidanaerobacteraceae bacterium]|nr:hypothetical protein [Tepidanaerobacteraceae bacterium]
MASPAVNVIRSDGSLAFQKRLQSRANTILDFSGATGLRFYSEKKFFKKLKKNLMSVKPGITFLGPGDFHHLSLCFLEKITQTPVLVLFDHHSDMQSSPEGFVTCGSWVGLALSEDKVKRCIIVGVSSKDEALFKSPIREKVIFLPEEIPHEKKVTGIIRELVKTGGPVYISIDKDVLAKKDAQTNWDQGRMSLEELLDILEAIGNVAPVVGADVCGEWRVPGDPVLITCDDMEKASVNERANLKILEKLLEVWQKDKKNSKISLYKSVVRG